MISRHTVDFSSVGVFQFWFDPTSVALFRDNTPWTPVAYGAHPDTKNQKASKKHACKDTTNNGGERYTFLITIEIEAA